ncbi:MAG: L,D-transpeptidase family protein, partial [Desulfobulbaceae bacterium]|nr:L,D-transpeptidase family protein [Desulfobulbaceae bacterium]
MQPPVSEKAVTIKEETKPRVQRELATKGFQLGRPIFIRIFKLSGDLEIWIQKDGKYQLFKSYPICSYSGYPGPKTGEGDWQSPEGFYSVSSSRMNPNSSYHLSFNIGYPNEFDKARNRTGSCIMVHGDCSSRGCFAMGDHRMEEIYLLAYSALARGQEEFGVHVFPFKLNAKN